MFLAWAWGAVTKFLHCKYVFTLRITVSQFSLQRNKDYRLSGFSFSKLLFAFCCNNSPDRKIEAAASDKGGSKEIFCVTFFIFIYFFLKKTKIKNNHVAQMIRVVVTFSFCARLEFAPSASDRVSVLLHSPLSFNRIVFGDACLEFACKPATYPTRTHETL